MKLARLLCWSVLASVVGGVACAEDNTLPGGGWQATRYETLWTKSPFSVATPDAAPETSEYSLWGIAQIDGISYASLTDKSSNEHFVVSTDKPVRGMTLVSVTRGASAGDTTAVIQKDGQPLTLKQEQSQMPQQNFANGQPPPPGPPVPQGGQVMNGGIPNPNAPPTMPGNFSRFPGAMPPPPVLRRPLVHVPPMPQQQQNFQNQSSK